MEQQSVSNGFESKSQKTSNVKAAFQEAGQQATDAAKKVVNELSVAGKETLATVNEEGKKQLATLEGYVRDYPIRSMAVSALAGAILYRIIR